MVVSISVQAQELSFSTIFFNDLLLNPALAGDKAPRIGVAYRNQMPVFNSAFSSKWAWADASLGSKNSGVAAFFSSDKRGDAVQIIGGGGMYSYSSQISEQAYMRFGLKASLVQWQLNASGLLMPDGSIGEDGGLVYESMVYPDFSIGAHWYYRQVFLGTAVNHLGTAFLSKYETWDIPEPQLIVYAGKKIKLQQAYDPQSLTITPFSLFSWQNRSQQFLVGFNSQWKILSAGVYFRNPFFDKQVSSIIISGGFTFNWGKISYTYDRGMLINGISINPGYFNSHEISLLVNFINIRHNKNYDKVKFYKF